MCSTRMKGSHLLESQLCLRSPRVRLPDGPVRALAVAGAGAPHAQRLGLELRERLLRLRRLRGLHGMAGLSTKAWEVGGNS